MRGVSPFSTLFWLSDATISVFTSSPFKFVIDGNLLYVHAGLIALHSKPLNRMINGHMSEAQQGYAELQDVDKGTFIRFMEWAYSGIYVAAEFRVEPTPKPGKKSKKGRKASNVAGQTANEIVDEPPSDTESTSLFGLSEPREPTSTP